MYAVIEYAGMDKERPVANEFESPADAYNWVAEHYDSDEIEELSVDVMAYDENGNLTTEF